MNRLLLAMAVVSALSCGCTAMVAALPPSREKTTLETAVEENARLKKSLETEVAVNYRLAYALEMARIDLEKAEAGLAAAQGRPAATVPAFQDYEVDHIRFGLLTGAADWDETPEYDGIYAYLLLLDSDNDVLKRKGNCAFDLIDLSRGSEKIIMSWAVPAEVLGAYWHSVPPGFRVKLTWQGDVPYGDECVLRATFTDAYGRTFTASKLMRLEKETPPAEAKDPSQPQETPK